MATTKAQGVGATVAAVRAAIAQCIDDRATERSKGVRTLKMLVPALQRLARWGGTGRHDPASIDELAASALGLADFVALTKTRDWKARAESEAFAVVVQRARRAAEALQ
jgi:hypothetical protein